VKDKLQRLVRISWLDSCGMPSRIHLTADGVETICGGHAEYIANRKLVQSPRKDHGRGRYCRRCFSEGGKALPWDSRCIDANNKLSRLPGAAASSTLADAGKERS